MATVAARMLLAAVAGVCTLAGTVEARASSAAGDPPATGEGRLATRDGRDVVDVPLEHTQVRIVARGHMAEVQVEQRFRNPYDRKIEAVYLFPLPTGAAVHAMAIETRGQVVAGEIHERAEAKATYVRAKKAGLVAALLTQERPNLFTQHVANIEPGERVTVRLSYVEALPYRDGGYELVFPMVAGPRYVPKSSRAGADAEVVQPAVLPPGVRSSHDIDLAVDVDAGVPIVGLTSPSHRIDFAAGARASRASVTLAAGDTIPNKDFVLRYAVAGEQPELAVLAHRDPGVSPRGAFTLMLQPPRDLAPVEVTPREIVLVVDTSSSMRGAPLDKAKALVKQVLAGLGADDTFQIIRFADGTSALGERPLSASAQNRTWAGAWVDALAAGGTTEMTAGIGAALAFPHDPARLRLVVFITDGYVGNEDEILAAVQAQLGDARLFAFGVGTAVNRYLLEELAGLGRGVAQVVRPDEDTSAVVARFHERIARPVLTALTIDWGGLAIDEVTPAAVPDLFMGQPLVVSGRYARAGRATVTVRGKAAGRAVSFTTDVVLPDAQHEPAVASVWARARIAELSRQEIRGATAETRAAITALALEHHLMSKYTAFVAVDRSRVTDGGEARRVAVPVEVPAGLRAMGHGGGMGVAASGVVYGSIGSGYGGGMAHQLADGGAVYGGVRGDIAAAKPAPTVMAPPRDLVWRASESRADGDVGANDYKAVFTRKKARIVALFQHARVAEPSLAGKWVVKVSIGADGRVVAAQVTSPAGGEALGAQIAAEVKTWTFPASGDSVTIVFPYVLAAE